MEFDPNNKVVQLCAKGMELEGHGQPAGAGKLFTEAWAMATTDFKEYTAAHYVARHQQSTADKLVWDKTALQHALLIKDESIKATLSSLHLNIGKCYEDLHHFDEAKNHYGAAFSFASFLPNDGYGGYDKKGNCQRAQQDFIRTASHAIQSVA